MALDDISFCNKIMYNISYIQRMKWRKKIVKNPQNIKQNQFTDKEINSYQNLFAIKSFFTIISNIKKILIYQKNEKRGKRYKNCQEYQ